MTQKRPQIKQHKLVILVFLCLTLCGCGPSPNQRAAQKIAEALPSALGPAEKYDVQVDGSAFDLARGKAKRIHIDGRQVQVTPNIRLDTLTLDAQNVRFNIKNKRLERAETAQASAVIGQENLDAYLRKSKPNLTGLKVTLRENDAEGQIPITVLGLNTSAKLVGIPTVSAASANKLDFTATQASLGHIRIPATAVNLALSQLNPLIDLSILRYPIAVQETRVENGHIFARGAVDLSRERVNPKR